MGALGQAYVRFAVAHPHHFRLLVHNPLGGKAAPPGKAFALLRATLARAQKAGAVRGDLDARALALGAWAIVHGLASLLVEGNILAGEAQMRRYLRLLEAIFFDGVGVGGSQQERPRRRSWRMRRRLARS